MIGVFLDTETNGLNPMVHKIVEIAFVMVDLATGNRIDEYQALISQSIEAWNQSDPTSLKINGFTWEEVSKGKAQDIVAHEIMSMFSQHGIQRKKAVFICQNPSFDRVFFGQLIDADEQEKLNWPYHWLDLASMHWALTLNIAKSAKGPYPWETGLSKDMIAAFHQIAPESKPHRAMNGASHLLLCYQEIMGYPG